MARTKQTPTLTNYSHLEKKYPVLYEKMVSYGFMSTDGYLDEKLWADFDLLYFRDQVLGDSFEEFKNEILIPNKYPTSLLQFIGEDEEAFFPNFTKEYITTLSLKKITKTADLLSYDRFALYDIVKNDVYFKDGVDSVLQFYGFEPLVEKSIDKEIVHKEEEKDSGLGDVTIQDILVKPTTLQSNKFGSKLYSHFRIRIASPDEIRMWSFGEVRSHETINYKSSKPEKNGLFCEQIFGPVKDFTCGCGKKPHSNIGTVCEKCGIEIIGSKVRRERMGHIELLAPIVHPWYIKNNRLSLLLKKSNAEIVSIIAHTSFVVTECRKDLNAVATTGETIQIKPWITVLNEQDFNKIQENESMTGYSFEGKSGGEAIKALLKRLDLAKEIEIEKIKLKKSNKATHAKIIKRLQILQDFFESDNKPEWIVMEVIPVIPPDLRPMVALDAGRYATTDLNDLYRNILIKNDRLKILISKNGPEGLLRNEQRLIQESINALFDAPKRNPKSTKDKKDVKKSLSESLHGKQGRFRQNLLGKRVDYSGRSVIIIGPDLKMFQCGLPREMAYTLYKPFILKEIRQYLDETDKENTKNKNIQAIYESKSKECWEFLEKVSKEHPVLLNRAPTLHRLGIQAFEPKLIDGKAIRLHPLVTTAFNADFDGDQMAVHLPLSNAAQAEARLLMLASNNILNPKDGKPVVTPTQDMVLGNYYLTLEKSAESKDIEEGHFYSTMDELDKAYSNKFISLHTRVLVSPSIVNHYFTDEQKEKYLITTYGKLIFNQILPSIFPYFNSKQDLLNETTQDKFFIQKGVNPKTYLSSLKYEEPFNKTDLSIIISRVFKTLNITETSIMLDLLKDLGFKYSTVSGTSISFSDVNVYSKKKETIDRAYKKIDDFDAQYEMGFITNDEKAKSTKNLWRNVKDEITNELVKELDSENSLFIMMDSKARGSKDNFAQLAGLRGLMNNPKGETIEVPIISSFREGLTVSEFFISTHGSRKGSTDTALKTSKSGYLTRRLVDVVQDIVIVEDDCGTDRGLVVKDIVNSVSGKVIVNLTDRIIGRYANKNIYVGKNIICKANDLITEEIAAKVKEAGITEVEIRSTLTCASTNGVCAKCYGKNLATNTNIEVGETVGVIAAQSIGEPGTQLTMRTFHTGGVESAEDITTGLPRVEELFEARDPKAKAVISPIDGTVIKINENDKNKEIIVRNKVSGEDTIIYVPLNDEINVVKKQEIFAGDKLTKGGSIKPGDLLDVSTKQKVQNYIIEEVQKVYQSRSVDISNKHIELIVRQMFKRCVIQYPGAPELKLLPGVELSIFEFSKAVNKAIDENLELPAAYPVLYGIAKAASKSDSLLSAASFQETTKALTDGAIKGKPDELRGLKENAIIGGIIPAGTGIIKDIQHSLTVDHKFLVSKKN